MSRPRPIFRHTLYMITRRTNGRRCFLKPTRERTKKIEYCIAVAAKRHGILIHAVVVLGNHWHCVGTDPNGVLPAFLRDAHAWIAKVLKKDIKLDESFWDSRQTSLVRAEGAVNVLERIIYTMANPTAAGLVAHGRCWPGLRACWAPDRTRTPVPRPSFFAKDGTMPETATLVLHRPPGFNYPFGDQALAQRLQTGIEGREQFHRDIMRIQNRRFMGRRAILAQSDHYRPKTIEPKSRISPEVAEKDPKRRAELLTYLKQWRSQYQDALDRYRAGDHTVIFPPGTYKLHHELHVNRVPD